MFLLLSELLAPKGIGKKTKKEVWKWHRTWGLPGETWVPNGGRGEGGVYLAARGHSEKFQQSKGVLKD